MRRPLHNAPQPEHPVALELGSPGEVVSTVLERLSELGIDAMAYEADHICFRCATTAEYKVVSESAVVSAAWLAVKSRC